MLIDLWLSNGDLGNKVAGFPWVTDGVTDGERNFVAALGRIARADLELAKTVANLHWLSDDVNDKERVTIQILDRIASEDIELARRAAGFQWFAAEAPEDRMIALSHLRKIGADNRANNDDLAELLIGLWFSDVDLGAAVAGFPWVKDGVTGNERALLAALSKITHADLELAKTVAALPWLSDDVTQGERGDIQILEEIASDDVELARQVAGLQWFSAGMPNDSMGSLWTLRKISANKVDLAMLVARSSWFEDGLTSDELISLYALWRMADNDHLELARNLAGSPLLAANQHRDLQVHALAFLGEMAASDPHALYQLTALPWFADGLDEEEMAFIVALLGEASNNEALFTALLNGHYTHQSTTVSLPLAGDVNIWVFQSTPVRPEEDIPTVIEGIVPTIEGFIGLPLPTTDVIVLIENRPEFPLFFSYGGQHRVSYIKINREYAQDLETLMTVVAHELTHYYHFGPPLFNESVAHLMQGYVNQKMGIQSMAEVRAEVTKGVQRYCSDEEIATVRHALFADQFRISTPGRCTRAVGLSFLHHALEIMGEERFSRALRYLYTLPESQNGGYVDEEAIYHALLRNTPSDHQEEFRDLYRRLHAEPYADSDKERADDHGDSEETATEIAAGQVVVGRLDYGTDFDYFRLQAQENQKYRFEVDHETLRASEVMVFDAAGKRTFMKDKVRVSSGPLVQWVAPSTDSYYFAVLNWWGTTGRYTLRITQVPDVPDDHGDNKATATNIAVGKTIHGVVDDAFDLDYFRLPTVAAETYVVKITGVALEDCCVALGRDGAGFVWDGSGFSLRAVRTGERYLVVHGGHENTGAYTLELGRE